MSFRSFIYYCALCGGCTALVGWFIGRLPLDEWIFTPLLQSMKDDDAREFLKAVGVAGFRGMMLGILVALGLGILDAMLSPGKGCVRLFGRVTVAVMVGGMGGLLGGAIGQAFFGWFKLSVFQVLGWTFTGFMIGAAPGMYDLLERLLTRERMGGAIRKLIHGLIGGFVGGFLGGLVSLLLTFIGTLVFRENAATFWTPFAAGFIALGMCIGLLIGTAQVVLKEAWLKIESGRRAGREVLLTKPSITIGRAESCDIGLFGDPTVERKHARIVLQGNRYLVEDADTPTAPISTASASTARGRCVRATRSASATARCAFGESAKRPA